MSIDQLKTKIVTLFKEKEKTEKEIEKLQNKLVQQLCPKDKQECEPAYCTFRMTETCPFLKEWYKVLKEAQVPEETKYNLFIDFVEKIAKDKGISQKRKSRQSKRQR